MIRRRTPVRSIAVIVLALLALPPPAEACINAVQVTQSEAMARIFAVEAALRLEQYWFANLMIPVGPHGDVGYLRITDEPLQIRDFPDESELFEMRLVDARYVIAMRWGEPQVVEATRYFPVRFQIEKAPRFVAWQAEALALMGSTEVARDLLRDLDARDLMPDAHAYATLATLTRGPEQRRAAQHCRERTAVQAICPPAPTTI